MNNPIPNEVTRGDLIQFEYDSQSRIGEVLSIFRAANNQIYTNLLMVEGDKSSGQIRKFSGEKMQHIKHY